MSLAPISLEQKAIVDLVKEGRSIQVDAVAGSGKTTTCLYIAKENPDKKIIQLTYNAKLKLETREKAATLGLSNIEVHSYHAFCVKYFYSGGHKDSGILRFLKLKNKKPLKPLCCNLFILDEAQDMNPTYYELVLFALRCMPVKPQLIVMGDRKQSIYAFNKADSRFLTMSDKVFDVAEIKSAQLSTSYRITKPIAEFINKCCNGALPIRAERHGCLPQYMICNSFDNQVCRQIQRFLACGRKPQDIFVLGPSVKSDISPIRVLANKLTEIGIPIYVPSNDEERLDEDILLGKVVFSTFHQVKGLERPVVFVFNFDNSYFEYFARDIPVEEHNQIPNTLYVAITRAKEILIMIHDVANDYLPFLDESRLGQFTQLEMSHLFRGGKHSKKPLQNNNSKPTEFGVCELVKFVPVDILTSCIEYISVDCKQLETPNQTKKLGITQKSLQDELYECVSDINGVALPSFFELKATSRLSILEHIHNNKMNKIRLSLIGNTKKCLIDDDDDSAETSEKMKSIRDKILVGNADACQRLLRVSTEWVCIKTGYNFKKNQIKDYDWLTPKILDNAMIRLGQIFSPGNYQHLAFEKDVAMIYNGYLIIGFIDIYNMSSNELWELKTVKDVDCEHFLQVSLYRWLALSLGIPVAASYIYNIYNNKLYTISANREDLDKIANILIEHKRNGLRNQNDAEFLEKCQMIREKMI